MVKTNAGKLKSLTVGSRVFYPGHGVASVAAIEERELGGGVQKFYVLALELDPGVKLFLPVDKVDQAAVRELVSAAKARQLLKMLAEEVEPAEVKTDPSSRKLRATSYSDGLRSGSPERYTEILRDLLARSRAGKLAPSEQQTLTLALDMFVGEVSASLERPPDEVRAEVAKVTAAA